MKGLAAALTRRIWPQWGALAEGEQRALLREMLAILYSLPLVVLTTLWLAAVTDMQQLRAQWPFVLLLMGMSLLAGRIYYFQIVGREAGQYNFNSSDLENVVTVSAVLVLGPVAIWAHVGGRVLYFVTTWPRQDVPRLHANWARNLLFNVWAGNLGLLSGFAAFQFLGGRLPLPDLSISSLTAAGAFVLVDFVVSGLTLWLLIWQQVAIRPRKERQLVKGRQQRVMQFFLLGGLPSFFGILGAAIYAQMNLVGYLFFITAVLLVSFLARRQSQAAALSEQRARQLAQLEELGRAFIRLPADIERLPDILRDYLPRMFDYDRAEVTLFDGTVLLQLPAEDIPRDPRLWEWLRQAVQPAAFVHGDILPWSGQASGENLLLSPIRHTENDEPLGGICLRSRGRITLFGFRESLPSLQVLSAQIASVLHRRETYEKRLALQRVTQELALARQMQSSFLPQDLPRISGWELRAMLQPARQTSGDFYDVMRLAENRLGLLVADVADKGMSAALFMALSRTLLRTYAYDYPDNPARVLHAANRRMLTDTTDDSFVTVFYGVLDLRSGRLCYANAGHNPPYVLGSGKTMALANTGMPLGIQKQSEWAVAETEIAPGELLLLYSDGITDAHNKADELFGADRLLQVVNDYCDEPLPQIESVVLRAVTDFAAGRAQFDDLTLMLARRNPG